MKIFEGVLMKYDFTTDSTSRLLPEQIGDYLIHRTGITIVPIGEPLYSVRATEIEINAEVGGEYVKVMQVSENTEDGTIIIDEQDWPVLRQVIDAMVARCRTETQEGE